MKSGVGRHTLASSGCGGGARAQLVVDLHRSVWGAAVGRGRIDGEQPHQGVATSVAVDGDVAELELGAAVLEVVGVGVVDLGELLRVAGQGHGARVAAVRVDRVHTPGLPLCGPHLGVGSVVSGQLVAASVLPLVELGGAPQPVAAQEVPAEGLGEEVEFIAEVAVEVVAVQSAVAQPLPALPVDLGVAVVAADVDRGDAGIGKAVRAADAPGSDVGARF